jgi:hypothetical protein
MGEKRGTAAWALMLAMIGAITGVREAHGGPVGLAVLTAGPAMRGVGSGIVAEGPSPIPRVRSSDSTLAGLIDRATRGSETFRRLITSIQASNGIVYVEPGRCGHGVRACLKIWMQVGGPNRFLRIVIDRSPSDRDVQVMGSLGHELQHAVEVLSEPAVTNGATMYNFLRRTASNHSNRFETTAAVNAGNDVIDELLDQRAAR